MSKVKWTKEQEAAIQTKDCNLLVSAAAGSGKTAVLVERIVRRILDEQQPLAVDRLLVVTFTNAAAREMKERIDLALTKCLREDPTNEWLQKQRLLLNKAFISTIHAFCLDLIRQNYYRLTLPDGLALDPAFRISDDVESALLKIEVLENLFEEKYKIGEPTFLALVEGLGGERDDRNLRELILKINSFLTSLPEPKLWLRQAVAVFQAAITDPELKGLRDQFMDKIILDLEEAIILEERALTLALLPDGPQEYALTIEEELNTLKKIKQAGDDFLKYLAAFKFPRLKACRSEADEFLKEEVKALRDQAKGLIQNIQGEYLRAPLSELIEEQNEMYPLMKCLAELTIEFEKRYFRKKIALNVLDFADLEFLALNLLGKKTPKGWEPTPLAVDLQKRFEEVLIDEYQDINGLQETILTLLAREKSNLFMVGDVKQSIYGFRSAEPSLFLNKYNTYSEQVGKKERKINLSKNFRSRINIVKGVNFIFRQLMSKHLSGQTYDQKNELVFGAHWMTEDEKSALPLEFHLLETRQIDASGDEADEEITALQAEARLIGRRLLELQDEALIWDQSKQEYRQPEFRDIVILLRMMHNTAPVFLEEFQKLGIPVYAEIGSGYFAAREVQIMMALLKIIDNPYQEIPLAAVLFSPLVGLNAEEMVSLRTVEEQCLFTALNLARERVRGELGNKAEVFLERLEKWRTFARRNSVVELLGLLYQETGYYDYVGSLPGGKQRQANLRALLERAKQFEQTTLKGLFNFLRFLKRLADSGSDLGTAKALGENENVVRLMSIHQSKGLEFPIVFLGCLGKQFNFRDLNEDLLIDRDLGLGPVWVNPEARLKYPTLAKLVLADKIKAEMLAEEMRILYVAMTRARDNLILVGVVKDQKEMIRKWQRLINPRQKSLPVNTILQARTPLDWLGPSLLRHPVAKKISTCQLNDASHWQLKCWSLFDLDIPEKEKKVDYQVELNQVKKLLPLNKGFVGKTVASRLNWVYPEPVLANLPSKLSVTEIKNRYYLLIGEQEHCDSLFTQYSFAQRPRFLQKEGLTRREKGTALHLVMRYLDFARATTLSLITTQIKEMVERQLLTDLQAKAVDKKAILEFVYSPLGKRIKQAEKLQREVPFMFTLPAEELYPEARPFPGKTITVQGTVDCLFKEGNQLVLVDYKTDRVEKEVLCKRYQVQMDLYARALSVILELPIKEKILYSFYLQIPLKI